MWQKSIQPSEFDTMDYWEFEQYIIFLNERNEAENEQNKKQNEQQQEQQQNMMPKMPDFNSFKPGNFNMPKF